MENYCAQKDLPGHCLSINRLPLGVNIQPGKCPVYQSVSRNDREACDWRVLEKL